MAEVKFEDLLVKMYEILNDTIELTIQQKQYIKQTIDR